MVSDSATPWIPACQASLSITNSWSLLKLMSIQLVVQSNHLILCHPLLLCLQSFPASEFFQMSQFFSSGGQSIRGSASASVLPVNNQDCFPLGWTGLMSSESKGLSRVFSSTQFEIISSPVLSLLYGPIHSYVTPGKTIALTRQTFVSRLMSLSFNMLSRFV